MRLFTIKSLEPTIHVTHVVHAELKALSVCGSVIYIYIYLKNVCTFPKVYTLLDKSAYTFGQKCIHFLKSVYTFAQKCIHFLKSVYTFAQKCIHF